ncbi:MAG: hypothetical protein BGO10_05560 [Chlamydia sp. 32-24]|nr:MAG: hypothetical protein BGO10_05560 [Chlamydia sp. 32-24]
MVNLMSAQNNFLINQASKHISIADNGGMKFGSMIPLVGFIFDVTSLTLLDSANNTLDVLQEKIKNFGITPEQEKKINKVKIKGLKAQRWYAIKGAVMNSACLIALVALVVLGLASPTNAIVGAAIILAMLVYCIVRAVKLADQVLDKKASAINVKAECSIKSE